MFPSRSDTEVPGGNLRLFEQKDLSARRSAPGSLRRSRQPPVRVWIEGRVRATLGALLQVAQGIENGLMWLPNAGEVLPCGRAVARAAITRKILEECARRGFQVLGIRWCEEQSMTGCLLVRCFDSA